MKFLHLSDLHLGKRVSEISMHEDQQYILDEIIKIVGIEKPDAVCIAGDIYDKSVPSEEAMKLWDEFLKQLVSCRVEVFVSSGNHDSAVRLADHSGLIESAGIHISPVYNGEINKYVIKDEFGDVNIYMLPFVKPVHVCKIFPDTEIASYTDACRVAVEHIGINYDERNVLLAHQFITSAERSDSEEIVVGGIDNVDVDVFDGIDYVALGHIHGPQSIGRETVRYCGTPLKYSLSEKNHTKSVTVVEMGKKGDVTVRTIELKPLRDLRVIEGTFDEIVSKEFLEAQNCEDYVHIILKDEDEIYDAARMLSLKYPNRIGMHYENTRTKENQVVEVTDEEKNKSELDYLVDLYEQQNNQPMTDEQRELAIELFNELIGE